MKKLLLIPLTLVAFSASAATYNDNYGYDYSGADLYDLGAQNEQLRDELADKQAQLTQSFQTNSSLSTELAEANDDLAHCNWGNFVALQQLDIRTAERDALETANEELQDDLADILSIASNVNINNITDMIAAFQSIREAAGGN